MPTLRILLTQSPNRIKDQNGQFFLNSNFKILDNLINKVITIIDRSDNIIQTNNNIR
jgi:hypothetical protein